MAKFAKWVTDAAPDSPMSDVVRVALEVRLAAVQHHLPRAAFLSDENVEYVHAARVATRRASAALAMYRAFLPDKPRKRLRASLKEMRNSMGEARDLDVYLERFTEVDEPGVGAFAGQLEQQRIAAQRSVVGCALGLLTGDRLTRQCRRVVKASKRYAAKRLRKQSFGEWATGQLQQAWVPFAAAVPSDDPVATELHDFRIATKHFRYTLELLRGGLPETHRRLACQQIKSLQAQLGEIQDHAVAADKLALWAAQARKKRVRKLLARYQQEELEQYRGKSEAFVHWWRRDRIDELQAAVDAVTHEQAS
ncbi:CHAD domain-containing protein [Aeoliella mucimassa]|uniref:CHAD domain protein n=1 Tax=Aeoliella mucimassa TaxID=2527972 RepID=A0A518AQT9_9BACT|nr:CHAD domain-containing protein [Aeoliella mucimassa]QDU57075.1 CHAD domain protein [Aeoliella mucimassa]